MNTTSTSPADTQADLTTGPWDFATTDELFGQPYVDTDEWRDAPVRHRYVHGGFIDTDTRFSYYFPEPAGYEGRFFQHVTPFPQSENLAPLDKSGYNKIAFAVASGAYFVETNGGGGKSADPTSGADPSIGAYRANAASAEFSRLVANRIFGTHRVYGYLYGGSGGGYRSIGAAENTVGTWDGFAPHVIGSSMAIPNVFTVRMHAMRILRDKFPQIVDAYDVGGDPSALDLTAEESAALAEVSRMGFPPRSWFGWKTMGMHAFSVLYPTVMMIDPGYEDDFWTVDGYLGADPDASIHQDRIRHTSTVVELIAAAPSEDDELTAGGVDESFLHSTSGAHNIVGVRLADAPAGWLLGGQLDIQSGASAGQTLQINAIDDGIIDIQPGQGDTLTGLAIGDEVTVDNSTFLAVQTYHRHQVPGPDFAVWDQFRDENGEPALPQRAVLLGPLMSRGASGTVQSGRIGGKMIVVSCLLDREAFAWQADWYRRLVVEHLGDAEKDQFRLWYVDNALHGDDDVQEFPARTVAYIGALETALRQLAAWVEQGIEPSPTSAYEVVDGQIRIPSDVVERRGVQPVVDLTVDGASSTRTRVGESVSVRIDATAATGGVIVEVREVTTDAAGEHLGAPLEIDPAQHVIVRHSAAFDTAGVHFIAVRVTSQTNADPSDPHARVQNIARARVTVVD